MPRLILSALLCTIPVCPVTPLPDARVHMEWAIQLTGYAPRTMPRLVWADGATMDKLLCTTKVCRIDGAYKDDVIYLRAGYEGPELDGTLVHELTHHLQGHMHICKAEAEARQIEHSYQVLVHGRPADTAPNWIPKDYGC